MINTLTAAPDITWIGGNDRRLSRFENLFPLPNGVSYNSYVLQDEKTAIFDTADTSVADQYLENLKAVLAGKAPEYLIVLHMEPDHCSLIEEVVNLYPDVTIVGGAKTFTFLGQFFPALAGAKKLVVKEGDTLELGKHTLRFVAAPMVHWPEVMMAFDELTGALFSADAFGTFGALQGTIFADDYNFERDFLDDARRYYANIVGKYGPQVQAVLKKAAGLPIQAIFPLHGPVWRKDIGWFVDKYQTWSTYTPETDDIAVFYGSLYGHTAQAANRFATLLREETGKTIHIYDVSETDVSYLVSEVWRSSKIVIFSPTYNNGVYPPVHSLIADLAALGVQNRTFAIAENGTWAPVAGKLIREELASLKNCTVLEPTFTIKSTLTEADSDRLLAFAKQVAEA